MAKTKELREKRARLISDARRIYEAAERAGRQPSGEERRQFDTMMDDADSKLEEIERLERLERGERSIAETRGRQTEPEQPGRGSLDTEERRAAFDSYLRGGMENLDAYERRHLQAENETIGGALVAPQQMAAELIKAVDNLVVLRQLATKIEVIAAQSLGAVSLDADPADADWTAELATGSEDSTTAFGKRELHPHPLAKRLKVSNKLLRLSPSAANIVTGRLAYKFAVSEEKAFLTGDGAGKPLGVFTPHAQGISTARDVSTDNTTTAVTGDGLINAKYSLKEPYLRSPNLRWIVSRELLKQVRKIKDGDGQYVWRPGLATDRPDTLLDVPYIISEYCPNTFTTGQYVAIIGDFANFWIADGQQLAIQRLVELYAEENQTGFIGRLECDGMPVLEEAFARVKLA
jgi:HK97 family phage major capsid protein